MIAILRHRGFARLFGGQVVSMMGDWLTYVAVGVLAIDHGGVLAVLGVLLAHTVPRVVVAPLAGRVADRYDRRTVLVVGSLARGVTVVAMAVAAGLDAPVWVQVLLVVRMGLGAFVDAASGAAVPRLVPGSGLARAHALLGVTWSVVFTVGVAVGGVLTAGLGPVGVLGLDALTFFGAALLFAGLPRLAPPRPESGRAERGWAPVWVLLRHRAALRRAVLAKLPVMIANGGAFVLAHTVAGRQQGSAVALTLGGLHLLRALGTGLGPIAWVRISALRGTSLGVRLATGVTLAGVALFAVASVPVLQGCGVVLWGVGIGSHWATTDARVQRLCPDALRGRMSALDLVAHTVGQGVGGILGTLGLAVALVPSVAVGCVVVPVSALAWGWIERTRPEEHGVA